MDLTDEAKAEIAAAIKILREDGVHIHKTYAQFQKTLENPPKKEETEPPAPPKDGDPPPPKDGPTEPPKKAGLWWGNRSHDE